MAKLWRIFVLSVLLSRLVHSKPIYTKSVDNHKLEVRQLDGLGEVLPGLIGTAVGSAVTPGIGGIVGGIVGPIIGSIISTTVDNLLENMKEEESFTTARDAPTPYDSYVVHIPNLGPYVLLVPKVHENPHQDGHNQSEESTEVKQDKKKLHSLMPSIRSSNPVRVMPYKPLNFMKKPSGSTQVKLFHPSQN